MSEARPEPRLSYGAVHTCLAAICAENGISPDALAPAALVSALIHLSKIAELAAAAASSIEKS